MQKHLKPQQAYLDMLAVPLAPARKSERYVMAEDGSSIKFFFDSEFTSTQFLKLVDNMKELQLKALARNGSSQGRRKHQPRS